MDCVSHIGIGVMVLGISSVSLLSNDYVVTLKSGQSKTTGDNMVITLKETITENRGNYNALIANIRVEIEKNVFMFSPEKHYYIARDTVTTETDILTKPLLDIMVAMGTVTGDTMTVRVYTRPMAVWIWIGAIITSMGGFISGLYRLRKKRTLV